MDTFTLGDAWPDWWAAAVTANRVVTWNKDGRWRGGPDFAAIHTPSCIVIARKGDLIGKGEGAAIFICPAPSQTSSKPLSDRHAVGE